MLRTLKICLAIAAASIAMPALAQEQKKIGEWHLDIEGSVLAGLPPRQDVRLYEPAHDGLIRSIHHVVQNDGTSAVTIYAARDDGMEYPMMDDKGRSAGTIALTADGPNAQTFVTKLHGKVVTRGRTTVSQDGQRLTITMDLATSTAPQRIRTVFVRAK